MTNPPSGADWSQAGHPQPPKKRGPGTGAIVAIVLAVVALGAAVPVAIFGLSYYSEHSGDSTTVVTEDEAVATVDSGNDEGEDDAAEPVVADDMDAKADAAALGKEIATYFVDGFEPPVVEHEGDVYLVDGTAVAATPGVELLGFSATGSDDWCVWVHAEGGDVKDYQYSAMGGLMQGTCSYSGTTESAGNAADSAAQTDVMELGQRVSVHFANSTEAPLVTQEVGSYLVGGVSVPSTEGVTLGGFSGNNMVEFCVWVHAEAGEVKDYQYSGWAGIEPGNCSA